MTTFVKKYITDCDMYQQMKNHAQQPFGPLVFNKMPKRPWEIISMDLITQLPESNGYSAICVIIDKLIKRAHFISINNQFSSKNIAQLLYGKVYLLHRLPLQIISDKGVQYLAKLFQDFRNRIYNVDSISFTTRWTNRMSKPGIRAISLVLYGL